MAAPGTPKAHPTPSFSMTHTAAAAAVIFVIVSSRYSPPRCSCYRWGVIPSLALDYQFVQYIVRLDLYAFHIIPGGRSGASPPSLFPRRCRGVEFYGSGRSIADLAAPAQSADPSSRN